jgi:hypothetical protein
MSDDVPGVIENSEAGPLKDSGGDVARQFSDLPIGMLLCEPVMQVAKGQNALCQVYIDNIKKLAYKDYDPSAAGKDKQYETATIDFVYERPVTDKVTGQVSSKQFQVKAPLISLVPLPAFLTEELTVSFTMEV